MNQTPDRRKIRYEISNAARVRWDRLNQVGTMGTRGLVAGECADIAMKVLDAHGVFEHATAKQNDGVSADLYWPFTGGADTCYLTHDDDGGYRECCMRAGLAYALKLREEQSAKLLSHATEFSFRPDYGALNDQFSDDPEQHDAIVLSWRGPAEDGGDPDCWAVTYHHHNCWTSSSGWQFEPRPSSRDAEFLNDSRFTRAEAVALVPQLLREIEVQQMPKLRQHVEARGERQL